MHCLSNDFRDNLSEGNAEHGHSEVCLNKYRQLHNHWFIQHKDPKHTLKVRDLSKHDTNSGIQSYLSKCKFWQRSLCGGLPDLSLNTVTFCMNLYKDSIHPITGQEKVSQPLIASPCFVKKTFKIVDVQSIFGFWDERRKGHFRTEVAPPPLMSCYVPPHFLQACP